MEVRTGAVGGELVPGLTYTYQALRGQKLEPWQAVTLGICAALVVVAAVIGVVMVIKEMRRK